MPKRAFLASNVSSIISSQISILKKGPGCPIISIVIGGQIVHRALLDLGVCVNLLLFTVYERLRLGELRPTKTVLQLINRSTTLSMGAVEDVVI